MTVQDTDANLNENIGWKDKPKDDPQVVKLINHLEAHNGIKGLDIIEATAIERAVELFHRDGFVVVGEVLNNEQIDFLAKGCDEVINDILALDGTRYGNRGSHRYSFGGSSMTRSQLHHPAWQMMLENETVHTLLNAIFGSPDYSLRAASGDFCLPGATDYQPLHPDTRDWEDAKTTPFNSFIDPRGHMSLRDLPSPYVCVNFLPQDVTKLNGPTRQIPGTQNSRARIPNLKHEPEWMRLSTVCPAPAGAIMIRDVRAWHGGTPNVSDAIRSIPNLEFYAPWFREPIVPGITYQDFKKLSPRAQELAKFCVADSSEELITGPTLQAP
ncbi:MAG: phytanoyl-CoA dioxygenase family protein [Pseudomonadales bacterium]|nr:phytanoyl-CoA dioxygenase family protein [Pseudomonadales bacterium]